MANNELVHMTPALWRILCNCIVSRITRSSAENVEKEDGRMCC